jgi:hypothetical protein
MICAKVHGYVTDKVSGAPVNWFILVIKLAGTTDQIGTFAYDPNTGFQNYYSCFLPAPTTVDMTCYAPGYRNWNKYGISFVEGQTKLINIKMTPL